MIINAKYRDSLFLLCLGIFAGTAFCMKWMESSFYSNGARFSIIGLEISYSKDEMYRILSGLSDKVRTILEFHLYFDFAFMAAVYPGIALLCLKARDRTKNFIFRKVLAALASLQLIALACDIYENYCLLRWIIDPGSIEGLFLYHVVVIMKWTLALAAAVVALSILLIKRKIGVYVDLSK